MERPEGMPAIQSLEVMCGKDHMDVHLSFTQPFEGIVSSKGQYGDPRCVYVPPSTGKTFFSFRIAYARYVNLIAVEALCINWYYREMQYVRERNVNSLLFLLYSK